MACRFLFPGMLLFSVIFRRVIWVTAGLWNSHPSYPILENQNCTSVFQSSDLSFLLSFPGSILPPKSELVKAFRVSGWTPIIFVPVSFKKTLRYNYSYPFSVKSSIFDRGDLNITSITPSIKITDLYSLLFFILQRNV